MPQADQEVTLSSCLQLDMQGGHIYTGPSLLCGEGYWLWAISLKHTFATIQSVKAEDLQTQRVQH